MALFALNCLSTSVERTWCFAC
jgi:hypothetical protein